MFATQAYLPLAVTEKLAVTVGIGLLTGMEREWAHKDLGARSFAICALLGCLAALIGAGVILVAMTGVLAVAIFVNWRSLQIEHTVEPTTSAALLVTFLLGALVGAGHGFTAVASAIVLTGLLAWKSALQHLAGELKLEEIRSAVLLGLLAFVIYPILPNRTIDPWRLVNPREAWIVVVVVASIGFANYVLLRMYGARGMYYSGFLGGVVNSTAAAEEIAAACRNEAASEDAALGAVLLAAVAMFARNLLLLAILGAQAVPAALPPLGAMAAVALLLMLRVRRTTGGGVSGLRLESPVSIRRALGFACLFLVIQIALELAERHLGRFGFLGAGALGGLFSSASSSAAAATAASHGSVRPAVAGAAVVLASLASAIVDVPIVYRGSRTLGWRLGRYTAVVVVVGIAMMALTLLAPWRI